MIFVFTPHFVPCKLSFDDYESLTCKPCVLYFVSMNSHFLFHIWSQLKLCWNSTVQQCSLTSLGEEHWYSLETLHFWFEDKNKPLRLIILHRYFTCLTEEGRYLNLLQLHYDIRVQRGFLLPSATAHYLASCPSISIPYCDPASSRHDVRNKPGSSAN